MHTHSKLISIAQLSEQLGGLSRATIYRHIKNVSGFPQPIKIGSATRFLEAEVQRFINSKRSSHEVEQ